MSDELKPCPFCGFAEPRTVYVRDGRKVACQCNASGKAEFHGPADSPNADQRAIAAWNRRTPDSTRHADLIARLGEHAETLRDNGMTASARLLEQARVALGGNSA